MNLEAVLPEIIKPIAESIIEGFNGASANGTDSVRIGALKVNSFIELLDKNFGENGLRTALPMLQESMISSATQKNDFPDMVVYLSVQTASIIMISAIDIFLSAKGLFSFSGKKALREFSENGFYLHFGGDDMNSWEYSILKQPFSSVVREAEIMAELRTANIT
ncbi:hypothetical protein [Arsukibacterium perlucidum]|uniref:hypothetical protein n=1 Tax=Arsukibacterium perlucidum TaxID=368811 RepID=UPI000362C8AE|nr:hypothetical protein [Arsukibacterium perlucidum]